MDLETLRDTPPWEWPEDADKLLLGVLRDDRADASDRLLVAELAGDFTVINDDLSEALLAILTNNDESEEMRGTAAISFGAALEEAYIDDFEDPEDVPISKQTFQKIQKTLREFYRNAETPKEVRRRILEASVRAPEDWHRDAVSAAYQKEDEDWRLTAVFCMRFIRGFDDRIRESLESENPDIYYQAVCAAGIWEVDAAWSHIAGLIASEKTEKSLLLAAIEAAVFIRPQEASEILGDLLNSDDEDIIDAVYEALPMTGEVWDDEADKDKVLH